MKKLMLLFYILSLHVTAVVVVESYSAKFPFYIHLCIVSLLGTSNSCYGTNQKVTCAELNYEPEILNNNNALLETTEMET